MRKKMCLIAFVIGFVIGVKLNDKGRMAYIQAGKCGGSGI